MKAHSYSSEGIVLARKNYNEADRILSVYTKSHGRMSYIAKGIRKPKSRKRGHLEIFSHINFHAVVGRGIDLMTEVEIIDDFSPVRKNLKRVSLAYYICEVIGKITHEGEANLSLFNLILQSLKQLESEMELKKLRLDFIYNLLTLLGFWPAGKDLANPDEKLEEVIERQLYSKRVGKILSTSVN
jgi:DNA repair protein RecO (recombination protein O)